MNCGPPDQFPTPPAAAAAATCFLNLNWDQSLDPTGHLDSALTSMVSSGGYPGHGDVSPSPHFLNSPPKLNLSITGGLHHPYPPQIPENLMPMVHLEQFLADPGFTERAARLSAFEGRSFSCFPDQFAAPPIGLEPVGGMRDESSMSDPSLAAGGAKSSVKVPSDANSSRKRKAPVPKGKAKESPLSSPCKDSTKSPAESNGAAEVNSASALKGEPNGSASAADNRGKKSCKGGNAKAAEPPKDYIHVRARRGEATDSHSLAERVRREKISQRMKLLQDLVPGCSKVVGKAVMLDEIINYVQSLQRQVEFLSMKLAAVNPQLDFSSLPGIFQKDMAQQPWGALLDPCSRLEPAGGPLPYLSQRQQENHHHQALHSGAAGATNGMGGTSSVLPLDPSFCRPIGDHHDPFVNGVSDATSQVGAFWHDDFHSVVQMDIGHGPDVPAASSQSFNGSAQTVRLKMEP